MGISPPPSTLHMATAGKVPGVITTTTEQLFAMARKSSLWTPELRPGLLRHRNDVPPTWPITISTGLAL